MEGIPTLWNMSDLGTKRLSRQRREFLMYLIGVMEMHVEGADQVFCHVGEAAFNEELRKKDLAKQMKEVKSEMVRSIVEGNNTTQVKISKSMVKMVTLLLLQPRVYGQHAEESNESYHSEKKIGGYKMGCYILVFLVYTIMIFGFGIYIGYVKWKKVFWWHRKVKSLILRTGSQIFIEKMINNLQDLVGSQRVGHQKLSGNHWWRVGACSYTPITSTFEEKTWSFKNWTPTRRRRWKL